MQTAERLNALMDHLGLEAAFFATQVPGDVADLAWGRPDRIKGLVLCVPMRLDARPFERVAPRLLMISGEMGLSAQMTRSAQEHLPDGAATYPPGIQRRGLVRRRRRPDGGGGGHNCSVPDAPQSKQETSRAPLAPSSGTHAGLTYRIEGQGPALILLPFFLAPSQWEPALPELIRHFTVIQLGGPHIGGVAALEDRARAPTYQAMFRTLVDLMAPEAGSRILDVGCGSGALDRLLAARLGPTARIDAVDINPFLLREAADLARGLAASEFGSHREVHWHCRLPIRPLIASSPSPCSRSATPTRAIAEMVRVARPGARIGLVVRAIDIAQWWNLAAAGRDQGEGRNTSAVGRPGRRGGCQPVRAHASGGPRGPACISRAHHAR